MINSDQILSGATSVGRGPVDSISDAFTVFQAKLESGVSAVVSVDLSDDGVAWYPAATFTLDGVGQVVESPRIFCDRQLVSADVKSITGRVSVWKGE